MADLTENQLRKAEVLGREMLRTSLVRSPRISIRSPVGSSSIWSTAALTPFRLSSFRSCEARAATIWLASRSTEWGSTCTGPSWTSISTFPRLSQVFSGREPGWQANSRNSRAGRGRRRKLRRPAPTAPKEGGHENRRRQADFGGAGRVSLQSRRLGEIDAKAVAAALIAAGHFGGNVPELLLHIALVDLGRRGEAGAQGRAGEFSLPFAFCRSPRTPAASATC